MYNKKQANLENKITVEQKRLEFDPKRKPKRLNKLKKKRMYYINQIEKKLIKHNLSKIKHDDYPSLKAYVLFDDMSVAYKTIADYRNSYFFVFCKFFGR